MYKGKYIVLGVSFSWSKKKGIDVFVELANTLDNSYQIVLVGVPKKIRKCLPSSILCIEKTDNARELAQIYSAADVFVNPTREDNYPTVNLESIACGTPVITFDTGGCSETIDENTGKIVPVNDINELINKITILCACKDRLTKQCVLTAKNFDMNIAFNSYIKLYKEFVDE